MEIPGKESSREGARLASFIPRKSQTVRKPSPANRALSASLIRSKAAPRNTLPKRTRPPLRVGQPPRSRTLEAPSNGTTTGSKLCSVISSATACFLKFSKRSVSFLGIHPVQYRATNAIFAGHGLFGSNDDFFCESGRDTHQPIAIAQYVVPGINNDVADSDILLNRFRHPIGNDIAWRKIPTPCRKTHSTQSRDIARAAVKNASQYPLTL